MDGRVEELVASICNASSADEALLKYAIAKPLLRDYKIVYASDKGPKLGFAANRTFSAGAVVRSIFSTERVLVLDANTLDEMRNGGAKFFTDYSISLDTQTVSYLKPFIGGHTGGRMPKDIEEVLGFITRDDVYVDPMPYVLENLHNLGDEKKEQRIRDILKSYEVLRTIDSDYLQSKHLMRSKLSEDDLDGATDIHFKRMLSRRADVEFYDVLTYRHRCMYAYLLKMVEIQFRSSSSNIDEKMIEFLDFCHVDMACIGGREVALARAYFEKGQKLSFFGKIQKKRDDLFDELNSMAWDLYHVRQLEENMTFKPALQARYFFPALLTFDKRFIEIIDLYPLRSIAFKEGGYTPMPFYAGDWFDLMATSEASGHFAFKRYYSPEARDERASNRDAVKVRLESTIDELIYSVAKLASIEPMRRNS